jgi:hypothetical protein
MQQSWLLLPVNAFFKSAIRGQASTWNGGSHGMRNEVAKLNKERGKLAN